MNHFLKPKIKASLLVAGDTCKLPNIRNLSAVWIAAIILMSLGACKKRSSSLKEGDGEKKLSEVEISKSENLENLFMSSFPQESGSVELATTLWNDENERLLSKIPAAKARADEGNAFREKFLAYLRAVDPELYELFLMPERTIWAEYSKRKFVLPPPENQERKIPLNIARLMAHEDTVGKFPSIAGTGLTAEHWGSNHPATRFFNGKFLFYSDEDEIKKLTKPKPMTFQVWHRLQIEKMRTTLDKFMIFYLQFAAEQQVKMKIKTDEPLFGFLGVNFNKRYRLKDLVGVSSVVGPTKQNSIKATFNPLRLVEAAYNLWQKMGFFATEKPASVLNGHFFSYDELRVMTKEFYKVPHPKPWVGYGEQDGLFQLSFKDGNNLVVTGKDLAQIMVHLRIPDTHFFTRPDLSVENAVLNDAAFSVNRMASLLLRVGDASAESLFVDRMKQSLDELSNSKEPSLSRQLDRVGLAEGAQDTLTGLIWHGLKDHPLHWQVRDRLAENLYGTKESPKSPSSTKSIFGKMRGISSRLVERTANYTRHQSKFMRGTIGKLILASSLMMGGAAAVTAAAVGKAVSDSMAENNARMQEFSNRLNQSKLQIGRDPHENTPFPLFEVVRGQSSEKEPLYIKLPSSEIRLLNSSKVSLISSQPGTPRPVGENEVVVSTYVISTQSENGMIVVPAVESTARKNQVASLVSIAYASNPSSPQPDWVNLVDAEVLEAEDGSMGFIPKGGSFPETRYSFRFEWRSASSAEHLKNLPVNMEVVRDDAKSMRNFGEKYISSALERSSTMTVAGLGDILRKGALYRPIDDSSRGYSESAFSYIDSELNEVGRLEIDCDLTNYQVYGNILSRSTGPEINVMESMGYYVHPGISVVPSSPGHAWLTAVDSTTGVRTILDATPTELAPGVEEQIHDGKSLLPQNSTLGWMKDVGADGFEKIGEITKGMAERIKGLIPDMSKGGAQPTSDGIVDEKTEGASSQEVSKVAEEPTTKDLLDSEEPEQKEIIKTDAEKKEDVDRITRKALEFGPFDAILTKKVYVPVDPDSIVPKGGPDYTLLLEWLQKTNALLESLRNLYYKAAGHYDKKGILLSPKLRPVIPVDFYETATSQTMTFLGQIVFILESLKAGELEEPDILKILQEIGFKLKIGKTWSSTEEALKGISDHLDLRLNAHVKATSEGKVVDHGYVLFEGTRSTIKVSLGQMKVLPLSRILTNLGKESLCVKVESLVNPPNSANEK